MKRIIFVFLILFISCSAWATTYYTNGSGSEYVGVYGTYAIGNDGTGLGTLAAPWATLNKCVSSGSAGDTCRVAAASYTEAWVDSKGLTWVADGTVTVLPISASVFTAQAGAGNISLNGFTLNGNNTASYGINLNTGTGSLSATNVNIQNIKTAGGAVYRSANIALTFTGGTISGENVVASPFHISSGNGAITISGTTITVPSQYIFLDAATTGTRTLENITATVALSSGYGIYIYGTANFIISGGTYTISGTPVSFIKSSGANSGSITMSGTSINMDAAATSQQVINISAGTHAVDISANISAKHVNQNKTIIHIVDQPQPKVHNSVIDTRGAVGDVNNTCPHVNISSTGVNVGAAEIYNNTSYSTSLYGSVYIIGTDTSAGAGNDKVSGSKIYRNRVYGPLYYDRSIKTVGLHALEIAWSKPGYIYENYVNGAGYGAILKGGGHDWEGVGGAYYNVFVDIGGTSATSGQTSIIVKGATNVPVYNNTVSLNDLYLSAYGLLRVSENFDDGSNHYPGSAIVKNNIFSCSGDVYAVQVANDSSSIVADNNIYYHGGDAFKSIVGATTYATFADWQTAGYDANGYFADPLFTSIYKLKSNSPAINNGIPISGLTSDYTGGKLAGKPDIGAYERRGKFF